MLAYAVEAARSATANDPVVVVSPATIEVRDAFDGQARFALQDEPRGTADALRAAFSVLDADATDLLVLNGDTPFLDSKTLTALLEERRTAAAPIALLTTRLDDPDGYGRVVRDGSGRVTRIVEQKDSSTDDRAIHEVNAGVYAFDAGWTRRRLGDVPVSAASGELYITDLIGLAVEDGGAVAAVSADADEVVGINDRVQLAAATAQMRARILERHMRAGVTVVDPSTTYVDDTVHLATDVTIEPGVLLRGRTSVGEGTTIGAASQIVDSTIGAGCRVWASILENATLEDDVAVGPYAHLRPGAYIGSGSRIGNFAEVKQSRLAQGVVQHHFSYVGDADVGAGVNIGAGTVTANYDGERKNRTVIGEGAFIGSDSMLVAPVEIGPGAITAAGSVVTHDVPAGKVAVGVPARIRDKKSPADPNGSERADRDDRPPGEEAR
jgi:bifunctional UDP-N-acetylglucosamine pyrophosphorylase/glucosamine-1-phosphate N-acetyltransferase